jgi:hypothetical protein
VLYVLDLVVLVTAMINAPCICNTNAEFNVASTQQLCTLNACFAKYSLVFGIQDALGIRATGRFRQHHLLRLFLLKFLNTTLT